MHLKYLSLFGCFPFLNILPLSSIRSYDFSLQLFLKYTLIMIGPPSLSLYYYVLLCIIMYYYVLLCIIMYYYVLSCIIMYYYVLLCIIMYYHV